MNKDQIIHSVGWFDTEHDAGSPSVRLRLDGTVVYFDPALLRNYPQAPDADVICISHPHDDHCDVESIIRLKTGRTEIVTNAVVAEKIGPNVSDSRLHVLSVGETVDVCGVTVRAVPSYETESIVHKKEFGYTGFLVSSGEDTVYFSGDAGNMTEFEEFPDGIDVALLCVRTGDPYLMLDHMDGFARTVAPSVIVPVHWRDFEKAAVEEKGKRIPVHTEFVLLDRI
ncbi:MAG: MBL fold metallo-hydrolase [Spirochaetota bacterium]